MCDMRYSTKNNNKGYHPVTKTQRRVLFVRWPCTFQHWYEITGSHDREAAEFSLLCSPFPRPVSVSVDRMASSRVRLCTRHAGLQICGYATLSKTSRPAEGSSGAAPVFQYVGQHRKPNHKVFVWGFSFTGALGIPSFVVPDSGRKKPRKYQLTPYRLETAEQVNQQHSVIWNHIYFHFRLNHELSFLHQSS